MYFSFMVPRLLEAGYSPVILLREDEDYEQWRAAGAVVLRLPHNPADWVRNEAAFRREASPAELATCAELAQRAHWCIEPQRFYSDIHFAKRVGETYQVRLIHTFHLYNRSVVALALGSMWGIPTVLTILGEVVSEFGLRPEIRANVRWLLERFDRLLATSAHCASGVELVGMPAEKVTVIPYGVDPAFFRPADATSIAAVHRLEGRRIILFQGRLSEEKGPQVLLDALPHVFEQVPDATAIFVGPDEGPGFDGPTGLSAALQERVAGLTLTGRVIFTGAVRTDELPSYFSLAHVLAFPSTTAKECMGLSMKQAMACGVPVVAARAGGAPEAIEHGVTGLLCEPNDPVSLANAIVTVLTSPARAAMARASMERAHTLFTEERTRERTLALYRELL